MKKLATILFVLIWLTQVYFTPASAVCALTEEKAEEIDLQTKEITEGTLDFSAETAPYSGYIVSMREEVPMLMALSTDETSDSSLSYVAEGLYRTDDLSVAQELLDSGLAEFVEPDYIATLFDAGNVTGGGTTMNGWLYEMVNGDYGLSHGLTGEGVRIALIDSGLADSKPDLSNARIEKGRNFVQGTTRRAAYWGTENIYSDADYLNDSMGHGTYVTQMIAADQNGKGSTGVAPGATIIPLRVFGDEYIYSNSGATSTIISAIYAAVDDYHCDIINMSLGMGSNVRNLAEAVRYAASKGVIIVAAAGNTSSTYPQGSVLYPAAYDEVIGVGSLQKSGEIASSSQRTRAVYVSAPGDKFPIVDTNGNNATISGTSFASPCVAAQLALMKQLLPDLSPTEAMALVRFAAVDPAPNDEGSVVGYDTVFGYGTLDVKSLYDSVELLRGVIAVYRDGYMISATQNIGAKTVVIPGAALPPGPSESAGTDVVRIFYFDEAFRPLKPPLEL